MFKKISPDKKTSGLCQGRLTVILIDSNGDISHCVPLRNLKLGNIFEKRRIKEILATSINHQKIKNITKNDLSKCNSCYLFHFCDPCIGRAHFDTSSINTVDKQMCNYAQALFTKCNS
jgi:radical SAM protein with 4Fe4S-binding SPASM domain